MTAECRRRRRAAAVPAVVVLSIRALLKVLRIPQLVAGAERRRIAFFELHCMPLFTPCFHGTRTEERSASERRDGTTTSDFLLRSSLVCFVPPLSPVASCSVPPLHDRSPARSVGRPVGLRGRCRAAPVVARSLPSPIEPVNLAGL